MQWLTSFSLAVVHRTAVTDLPDLQFCGRILSIYEESDDWGQSCFAKKNDSSLPVSAFEEIALKTGLRHGFLFKAMPAWLLPTSNWAKGESVTN